MLFLISVSNKSDIFLIVFNIIKILSVLNVIKNAHKGEIWSLDLTIGSNQNGEEIDFVFLDQFNCHKFERIEISHFAVQIIGVSKELIRRADLH